MMTPKQLKETLKIASKFGVKHLKMENFEVEFNQNRTKTVRKSSKLDIPEILPHLQGNSLEDTEERPPTEDELLMYSSPAYDVIREQRNEATQAPK